MLFVSKYRSYSVVVHTGEYEYRTRPDGRSVPAETFPELVATFQPGDLPPKVLDSALRQLWSGDHPFGALPSMQEGVMDSGSSRNAYDAVDPRWRLSQFDTDNEAQCPPDHKALFEQRLQLRDCGFGTDYCIVEARGWEKPWPSYDEAGQGAAQKIPAMVRELGLDPEGVLEYERHKKNRPGIVEALQKLVAQDREKQLDDAPLEVTVP